MISSVNTDSGRLSFKRCSHGLSKIALGIKAGEALVLVLLIYHISRQLLISMVAGIAAINGLLWLLPQILN